VLTFGNFLGVLAVAVAAPILAALFPQLRVPTIVLEFVLGVIIGPDVLGWVQIDEPLEVLSFLALGFLLFTAGTEVEMRSLRGPVLVKALVAYAISFAIAVALAVALQAADVILTPTLIAIILSATGLGVVIPILREAGQVATPAGQTILVVATVAEFSAVLLLSLFFGEDGGGLLSNLVVVLIFAVVSVLLWIVLRWAESDRRLTTRLDRLEGGTVQIRIRLALLVLVAFLVVSQHFGLESILGAFIAGIVLADLRKGEREDATSTFWPKVDAIGFGFLIPVYFITSGVRFDLDSLLDSPSALAHVPLFLALFLVVRGIPALLFRRDLGARTTGALALLSATSLSFVITATDIGVRLDKLRTENATALVGAAVIAMVIFPMGAQSLLPKRPSPVAAGES
jgi:Kef-type K+ transport system membrane component KefB